jgi:hypothetical protein
VKPWLRNLLLVVLAVAVLAGVAVVSFTLGLRAAAQPAAFMAAGGADDEGGPRISMQRGGQQGERMFAFGRGGFQPFGRGGDGGNDERIEGGMSRFSFSQAGYGSDHHFTARVFFSLLRLTLMVAVIGALVLGVVAFFRTGGWRPAAAPARRTRR